jgi:hypothetical protein
MQKGFLSHCHRNTGTPIAVSIFLLYLMKLACARIQSTDGKAIYEDKFFVDEKVCHN